MRRDLIIGIIFSVLVHGGVAYLGQIAGHRIKPVEKKEAEAKIAIIEMPKVEPDEPEVVDEHQDAPPPQDFAPPQLNDVPQMVTDTSFVQKMQPPPPDKMAVNKSAIVIPQGQGNWAKGIGQIFDISQLDQQPVPTVQSKPQYPFEMRRAGISGTVTVDFIVGIDGVVKNAYAVSSTQREFEQSAVAAVAKWRFRPGRRQGHAVNVHMQVPIVFSLNNEE
jgi:periplasmic protein TonB